MITDDDYACVVCGKPDARMHEDADHWYCEEHYPDDDVTQRMVDEVHLEEALVEQLAGDLDRYRAGGAS